MAEGVLAEGVVGLARRVLEGGALGLHFAVRLAEVVVGGEEDEGGVEGVETGI